MKAPFVHIRRYGVATLLALFLVALTAPLAASVGHSMPHGLAPTAPIDGAACLVSCIDALATSPPASLAGGFAGWQPLLLAAALAPLALFSAPLLRRASRSAPHAPPLTPLGVRLLI